MKKLLLILASALSLFTNAQTGITWNMGMNIAASSFSNMHPRMAVDGSGNPLVIWGRMSDQSVFFSRWNGTAFSTPVKLNPASITLATASWMGPDIAAHGDTVYVVFKQTPEASDTCHIFCVHSYDGGITFSAPVQVDDIGQDISRFPTVTTDDTGNPIVAFMRFDMSFMNARWVVSRSTDFGNYFFPDALASGWSSGTSTVCDCCPGSVVCSGNNVAMLYRDNNSDIRDSWAGLSTDNGTTFTSGMNIDQQNWMIMMCVSSGPDGVIIGDTLYSVCMNGASGTYTTYFSASSISNATGDIGIPLATGIPGLTQQNYPRVAASGEALAIGWKQIVSGADQYVLHFTNNIANGLPALYDTVDLNNVTNVDVALSNGNIYTVWEDDGSGTVKFRSGSYNSTTGVNKIQSDNLFSASPNPAAGFLNIELSSKKNSEISVTNILSQEVFSQQIPASQKHFQINTSKWNNGLYFITVRSSTFASTQKLIIQNN